MDDIAYVTYWSRIEEVCAIEGGWHNGCGESVGCRPEDVLEAARALCAIGREDFSIFPTIDGQVQLECEDGFDIIVGVR